ncbi:MAG: YbaN family protein [Kiloniellaceae bacterium]
MELLRPQEVPFEAPESRVLAHPGARFGLLAFGWLSMALGLAGLLLPLVPSTVFFLLALWAFSRSSARFHDWLYSHPRIGQPLRDWHTHRLVPLPAKVLAVVMMGATLVYVTLFVAEGWVLPAALAAVLAAVAAYILTRPHRIAA